jgi:septin 3/9/12
MVSTLPYPPFLPLAHRPPLSWDPIIKYIKDQHSSYLRKELTAMRDRYIQDTRIHCCLYFINPTGHTLRPIDVLVMKKLSEVVNVVPVIAKSDSLTLDEREQFKQVVRVLRGNIPVTRR